MKDSSNTDLEPGRLTLADLDYTLCKELIAQTPLPRRDASRLLVLDRLRGALCDHHVADLPDLLHPGDLLVLNDTRVLPAKFTARRKSGGMVRGLFEWEQKPGRWRVMLEGSKRLQIGEPLEIKSDKADPVTLRLVQAYNPGRWWVDVEAEGTAEDILSRVGQTPLPPYIHRNGNDVTRVQEDRQRYQTVYARCPGAVAAPTAGLHLTTDLLNRIRDRGVETTSVTLHVGAGTFQPIRCRDLSQHTMHAEWYELKPETAAALQRCRQRGGQVIAVGTTTVRVLESSSIESSSVAVVQASCGWTDIFIHPPYRFRTVDALLTNFHLPGSTLLALVMALAGAWPVRRAYQHAMERAYRFYSYGDAMLIV